MTTGLKEARQSWGDNRIEGLAAIGGRTGKNSVPWGLAPMPGRWCGRGGGFNAGQVARPGGSDAGQVRRNFRQLSA